MKNLITAVLYFSATYFLITKAYPHHNPLRDLKVLLEGGGDIGETTVKVENLDEIGSLEPNATCAPTTTPSPLEPSAFTEEYILTHYRDSRNAPGAMAEPEPLQKNTHWDGPGNNIRNLPRFPSKILQAISPDPPIHNDGNYSCNGPRGSLVQISKSSKFFADKENKYTYEDAKNLCKMLQLTIADLDDIPDHHSLARFFEKTYKKHFAPSEEKYFIGMNDMETEGLFQKADGTNITYQSFHTSQPDDKNQTEDCTVLGKLAIGGPLGISDEDCNKTFKVLCMHPKDSECYKNTKEAEENEQFRSTHGIKLVTNITRRVYYASTYQVTWVQAIEACASEKMKLFDMDSLASNTFFRSLSKWEDETFNASLSPPIQYWTSGRFENTHMKAELYWHNETKHDDNDKGSNKTFTFSGIFQWSTKKLVDPGGPYEKRRDLCLSFGLESKDDLKPFIRNSNCMIPQYFICVQDFKVKWNQNADYNYDDDDNRRKRNAE